MHLNHIDSLNQRIISLRDRIDSVIAPPARRIDLLTSVPGVSKTVAEIIIAENRGRHDPVPHRPTPRVLGRRK
ncbi:transposase IS116/IS110/IS902 family protein [Arthrobacter sp. Hiyo6]|nr:transposase IS116/IS110/IS902 family protein [Arthrobacter sp. Hiyo6]